MTKSHDQSSGGRTARASLTRPAILAAALDLVGRDGFDALTMRSLAAELGAGAMALYRHFQNRDELVAALLDELLGTIPLTLDDEDDARTQLRRLTRAHHAMLLRVPSALPSFLAIPATGPHATRFGEVMIAVLHRAGITGEPAVAAFFTLLALNYGFAGFEARRRQPVRPDEPLTERIRRTQITLALLPEAEYPLTTALAGPLARFATTDAQYEFALDALLTGLFSTAAAAPRSLFGMDATP